MNMRLTQVHCKEVICISDGRRLGFVSDVVVKVPEGEVCAIVVPSPGKFMGILGNSDDFVIPWEHIKRIGPDIILVDTKPDDCRTPRPRPSLRTP